MAAMICRRMAFSHTSLPMKIPRALSSLRKEVHIAFDREFVQTFPIGELLLAAAVPSLRPTYSLKGGVYNALYCQRSHPWQAVAAMQAVERSLHAREQQRDVWGNEALRARQGSVKQTFRRIQGSVKVEQTFRRIQGSTS